LVACNVHHTEFWGMHLGLEVTAPVTTTDAIRLR